MEIKAATIDNFSTVQQGTGETKASSSSETQPEVKQDSKQETNQERVYSKDEISKELSHLNKWLESKNSHLHFVLHDKLNEYYVQIVNDNTNEVLNEIPSKKVMDMVANLYEKLGFIVDKKV